MLTITGMHCASCKTLLEDIGADTKGVSAAVADVEEGTLTVTHGDTVDWSALAEEIEADGIYRVTNIPK